MSAIRHLWHKHRLVVLAFAAASALTLFFLVRLLLFTVYWADPAHRNLAPEPWMTPGYIAHSWHLDPKALAARLGIPPGKGTTLAEIARDRNQPVSDILSEVAQVLAETAQP